MAYEFKTGKVYSFSVYATAVLDTSYTGVKSHGVVSFDIANALVDIRPIHAAVFTYLPQGTPNDPTAYEYLLLETTSGQKTAVGLPWIREDTIEELDGKTIYVTVGNASTSDVQRIRNVLNQAGYNQIDITLK